MKPVVKISVVIANWNGKHHLDECLRALLKQTFREFEIILIDNGSTDGSVEWVRQYFPWVRVVTLPENKGFCYANNLGYRISKGEFVALLNNDTKVEPEWLFYLHKEISKDARRGICVSHIVYYYDRNIIDAVGDCYDISGVGFKREHGENAFFFNKRGEVFGACACAALYRKSMLDHIGFFDENFFAIGEDIDISFRAKLAGYKCIYVPEAVVLHKISKTIGVGSDFQLYNSRRNVEYVYFKNMPLPLILLTLPMHLLYNLLTFIQALREGRQRIFLKAKYDFIINFKKVAKMRKKIQKQRRISLKGLLSSFSKNYLIKRLKKQEMVRSTFTAEQSKYVYSSFD